MTIAFTTNQISILFEIHAKLVQKLPEIMNKSQLTLYNAFNMPIGSRKGPQKCNTLEKGFSSLMNKVKWLSFLTTSNSRRN
jgi:hypothetical protein